MSAHAIPQVRSGGVSVTLPDGTVEAWQDCSASVEDDGLLLIRSSRRNGGWHVVTYDPGTWTTIALIEHGEPA